MRALVEIASFHAHVYFDGAEEEAAARALREGLAARFAVRLGGWRDGPVGPHPMAMYQLSFAPELFGTLVPWLMLNHGQLRVLIHPNSGDERRDHLADALWLGSPLPLDPAALAEERIEAEPPGEVNTAPTLAP